MKVEVLVASCCTPKDIQKKIVSVLEGLKEQVPDLDWNMIDTMVEPELAIKYRTPVTPAIYIDGKLEFAGYPKQAALEARIKEHSVRPIPVS